MKRQIMGQGRVAVIKYALKSFLYNRNKQSTERIKRKGVLNLILHQTSADSVRLKRVRVAPKRKGASFLSVFKQMIFLILRMFGGPTVVKWPRFHFQQNRRIFIDAAMLFNNLNWVPGR